MKLQFDNEAEVPQESKESFVEFEIDGSKKWMHKDLAETKKEGFRTLGQLTNLKRDFDGFKSKIETEREEAVRIAREESETKLKGEIEKLKSEGKTSELFELEKQQWNDRYLSLEEQNKTLLGDLESLQKSQVEEQNKRLATQIASQYVPSELVSSFSDLLMKRIKNEGGKSFFTNAGGDAVDGDMSRIVEVLNTDSYYKHYAKFPGSKAGFGGKGGTGDVTGKVITRSEFDKLGPVEKTKLIKSGVKVTT